MKVFLLVEGLPDMRRRRRQRGGGGGGGGGGGEESMMARMKDKRKETQAGEGDGRRENAM